MAYGYQCGVFSSRGMEESCRYRVDFMWLLDGENSPDHAIFARFRKRCANEIEDLFYQYVRLPEKQGETNHETVFIDGTKLESATISGLTQISRFSKAENRHLAEWRISRFTQNVKTYPRSSTVVPREVVN